MVHWVIFENAEIWRSSSCHGTAWMIDWRYPKHALKFESILRRKMKKLSFLHQLRKEMEYFYLLAGATLIESGPLAILNRCPSPIMLIQKFLGLDVDPNCSFISCLDWQSFHRSVLNLYCFRISFRIWKALDRVSSIFGCHSAASLQALMHSLTWSGAIALLISDP
jgi:hypothetical protein